MMRPWCRHDCFRVSCSTKRIISAGAMILNCSRVNCIIRRLHSPCDWSSDIFSLYGLPETWSLVRDCRAPIASNMTIRVSCLTKNCTYRTLKRAMILDYSRVDCIIRKTAMRCYRPSDIFPLYDLAETWPRYWHDYLRVNCPIKWTAPTELLNASRYQRLARVNCIVRTCTCRVGFDTFLLYDLTVIWPLIRDYFLINADVL